jgi:broad specificity phosphatase PhoE
MIWLIRHGQTEWNKKSIFRGHKDIPLSKSGRLEALLAARWLKNRGIHIVYSSPLKRASETASIIAQECNSHVQTLDALLDINFGKWEGKTFEWVRTHDPDNYDVYKKFPHQCKFPGGESIPDCFSRVFHAFSDAASKNENKRLNTAFVTHRVILKLILIGSLELPLSSFWKIQLDTCSISVLDLNESGFIVRVINSTCHLTDHNLKGADF